MQSEKGQILLVVVLAAVISLTVALSAISRTITNTKVSTEQTDSQRALSAAEAGVEQLIQTNSARNIVGTLSNKSSSDASPAKFSATATQISANQIQLNGNSKVSQDEGTDVWLSNYPSYSTHAISNGRLKLYWANNSSDCNLNAAVEIVVVSGNTNSPAMNRYVYDPCPSRANSNNFPAPTSGGTVLGRTYQNSVTISLANALIARVIPIYADAYMAVEGRNAADNAQIGLPSQGFLIESEGTSGSTARKVRVFQGYPKLPVEYFPYNIFLP